MNASLASLSTRRIISYRIVSFVRTSSSSSSRAPPPFPAFVLGHSRATRHAHSKTSRRIFFPLRAGGDRHTRRAPPPSSRARPPLRGARREGERGFAARHDRRRRPRRRARDAARRSRRDDPRGRRFRGALARGRRRHVFTRGGRDRRGSARARGAEEADARNVARAEGHEGEARSLRRVRIRARSSRPSARRVARPSSPPPRDSFFRTTVHS